MKVVLNDSGENRGQELVVKELNNVHNHPVNKVVTDFHAKKRKLDVDSEEMAMNSLRMNCNKKKKKQHKLSRTTGKCVTLRDLTNLRQHSKAKSPETLDQLVEHLKDSHRNLEMKVERGPTSPRNFLHGCNNEGHV
jgi:hypothetical protein